MKRNKKQGFFERFANRMTQFTGTSLAFTVALSIVLLWAMSGPLFDFSETWQLVINTGTTIITFLMVFLIQKSQNKDSKAVHLKLNELIAALEGTSNRMVDIEDLSEEELDQLHKFYAHISVLAKKDSDLHCSHSIDAAEENNNEKVENTPSSRKRKPVAADTIKTISPAKKAPAAKPPTKATATKTAVTKTTASKTVTPGKSVVKK